MKQVLLPLFSFTAIIGFSQKPCLTIEGTVTDKAIYIQNPEVEDGRFCADSVLINNTLITSIPLNQAAFEIPFEELGIQKGSEALIKIYHQNGCKPRVLNSACILLK